MAADLAVIVTARNEASRLVTTLRALRSTFPDAQLWVADDGSDDATAAVARGEGARVVEAATRLGKGGAATLAAEAVLREGDPAVLLADADLGESARELRKLVEAVAPAARAGAEAGAADAGATAGAGGAGLAVATFPRRVGGGLRGARGRSRRGVPPAPRPPPPAPPPGARAPRAG